MQEYIRELQEKAGLTEEQATKAVTVLIEKVKSKIPEPLQGMVEHVFADNGEGLSIQDKLKSFQQNTKEGL